MIERRDVVFFLLDQAPKNEGLSLYDTQSAVYSIQKSLNEKLGLDLGYKFNSSFFGIPYDAELKADLEVWTVIGALRCLRGAGPAPLPHYETDYIGSTYVSDYSEKALKQNLGKKGLKNLKNYMKELVSNRKFTMENVNRPTVLV